MRRYVRAPREKQLADWDKCIHHRLTAHWDLVSQLTERIQSIDPTDLAQVEFHQGYRQAITDLGDMITAEQKRKEMYERNPHLLLPWKW